MLVLSRKEGEKLVIKTPAGERIVVRVGVKAPVQVTVLREEIADGD